MPKVASQKVSACSTQDKAFICPVCGKTTKTKRYLKRHMDVHDPSTKNKYQCPEPGCSHSARQKANLKEHMKAVHLDIKDLSCPYCDFVTSRSANIIHHQKRSHPELPFIRLAGIRALSTFSPTSSATPSSSSSSRDSSPTHASTSTTLPTQPPVYDTWTQGTSIPDFDFDFDFDVLDYGLPTDVYFPPDPLAFELFPATSSNLADQDYLALLQEEMQELPEDQSPATLASPASSEASCGLRLPTPSWEQTASNQLEDASDFAYGYPLEGFSSQVDEWLSTGGFAGPLVY
ncbi:hypothetical protein CYLTODRAFT_492857 [Cylindrobasidium torrendii FP15055 ss-10]|uniref:C2H2-type domain-containing protein n=1 Tax=Cylindrobasidium torrendii FP15055 ss-10 TaxID=1314674 RepID=A0A0D7B2D2_9AGAR|nr:hypothetical protein CYLTODRAFT_492857 [Cylindrobasidium torrendii FP15055 ss-10]